MRVVLRFVVQIGVRGQGWVGVKIRTGPILIPNNHEYSLGWVRARLRVVVRTGPRGNHPTHKYCLRFWGPGWSRTSRGNSPTRRGTGSSRGPLGTRAAPKSRREAKYHSLYLTTPCRCPKPGSAKQGGWSNSRGGAGAGSDRHQPPPPPHVVGSSPV